MPTPKTKRKPKAPEDVLAVLARARANLAKARALVVTLAAEGHDDAEMARRYVEGASTATLANRFGVTPQTITNRLRAIGIPMRRGTYRDPEFYRDKANAMHDAAEANRTVAEIVQGGEIPPAALLARTTSKP